jgi:hypothetical protein
MSGVTKLAANQKEMVTASSKNPEHWLYAASMILTYTGPQFSERKEERPAWNRWS